MDNTLKDKVTATDHVVADAAKNSGHKIVTGTEKAADKGEQVSPPMPHGKSGRSNDERCTEETTDMVKHVAEGADDTGERVSPPMPRGKPWRGNDERCTEGTNTGIAGIIVHMDVIASCGKKVGVVDAVDGSAIKLTKNDSPDGQHHFIPMSWIETVDDRIHLNKNSKETFEQWMTQSASCCG